MQFLLRCTLAALMGAASPLVSAEVAYTWTEVTPPGVSVSSRLDIVTHPLHPQKLMARRSSPVTAGIVSQLFISGDSGASWKLPEQNAPTASTGIFAHPGIPGLVYSDDGGALPSFRGIAPPGPAAPGYTLASHDFGVTWEVVNKSPTDALSFAPFASDPRDVNHLFGFVRSQFGCGAIFLGCRRYDTIGIAQSRDGGRSWDASAPGIPPSTDGFQYIDVDGPSPAAPARLFFVSSRGAYVSRDSGNSWTAFDPGIAAPLRWIRADPRLANVLYALRERTEPFGSPGNGSGAILRSEDEGASWRVIYSFENYWAYVNVKPDLAVDPARPNQLWLFGLEAGVFRSADRGETWTKVMADATLARRYDGGFYPDLDAIVYKIVASPGDPGVVYAAQGPRIFRGVPSQRPDPVVAEFHYDIDRYWLTSLDGEAVSQDYRKEPLNVWRTGERWGAWRADDAPAGAVGSCRFWSSPRSGLRTRVLVLQGFECDALKRSPDWILEGENEFYAVPPVAGSCGAGLVPVRRFNNLQPDANHRWVADDAIAAEMRGFRAWYDEGVRFCARPLGPNE
jgi:hypothetical protein